jgi:cob(I)alamin adenosyltransferase
LVKLNKIYTRTGDGGETSLVGGERIAKSAPRMQAIGSIDETNAAIGVARAELSSTEQPQCDAPAALDDILKRIQNDLFDLGADIATPLSKPQDPAMPPALRILPTQVERLEAEIDGFNAELEPLRSFILPGGTKLAAALHLSRTICRRAERDLTALLSLEQNGINLSALHYLNRLSDLLFVAARYVNDKGKQDHLWTPGENR